MRSTWSRPSPSSFWGDVVRGMRLWRLAVVAAALVTAASPSAGGATNGGRVRHQVEIRGLRFLPEQLHVAPGDTVVWINRDVVPHTLTAEDESWDSQRLDSNRAWELRVTPAMTEHYFCRYHPAMRGHLRVRDP